MDDYEKAYNEQFMRAEKLEERIKELQESHDAWEGGKIVSRFNSKRILGGASDER